MNASTVNPELGSAGGDAHGDARDSSQPSDSVHDYSQRYASGRRPLRRAYEGRMLGGVAAGLAEYLGMDTMLIRLGFVLLTFMGGAGVPVYLAAFLLIPEEGSDESIASDLFPSARTRR